MIITDFSLDRAVSTSRVRDWCFSVKSQIHRSPLKNWEFNLSSQPGGTSNLTFLLWVNNLLTDHNKQMYLLRESCIIVSAASILISRAAGVSPSIIHLSWSIVSRKASLKSSSGIGFQLIVWLILSRCKTGKSLSLPSLRASFVFPEPGIPTISILCPIVPSSHLPRSSIYVDGFREFEQKCRQYTLPARHTSDLDLLGLILEIQVRIYSLHCCTRKESNLFSPCLLLGLQMSTCL